MSGRYKIRCGADGVSVYDGGTDLHIAGPMSWDSAKRHAAAMNKPLLPEPAAPCCDSAAKLKAAAAKAERYRHALAQIDRYTSCPTARRYADDALFAAERETEDGQC